MTRVGWLLTAFASAVVLSVIATPARAQGEADDLCAHTRQQPQIVAARAELQDAPRVLAMRLQLSDMLVSAGCYTDAVEVLEAGEALHPHSSELQSRLSRARSMVKEKVYFEGLDEAEATAELRRQVFRCAQLADTPACDAAQAASPGNAEIALAKGNALLKSNRLDEAIAAYSRAAQLAPGNASIADKLQSASAQHQALMQKCTDESGEAALRACQTVLSVGSPAEFDVRLHLALLQQSAHLSAQALDSYIAANALQPGNKAIALAILALLDSTQRQDALGLQARGSSLLTLGRTGEAASALRAAATLAPNLPDVQKQLAATEAQARAEAAALADTAAKDKAARAAAPPPRLAARAPPPTKISEAASVIHYSNDEPAGSSN
jgi:tetratricopeptide (TPR) repeat protein